MMMALFPLCPAAQTSAPLSDTLPTAVVKGVAPLPDWKGPAPQQQQTRKDWMRTGAADMTGVLRRFAGIGLRDYGGAGGLKTVSVRGLGAAHTVVAYDGLAVNDARQGQADLSRYHLDELDGMALYVADMPDLLTPVRNMSAATLNLTTPQPRRDGHLWHGRAAFTQGAFSTYAPSFGLDFLPHERVAAGVAAHYSYGENDYPFTWKNGTVTTHERRTHSRMQNVRLQTHLHATDPGGGRWEMLAAWDDDHRRLPGQVILYTDKGTERLSESRTFVQLTHRRTFARNWRWMAAAKFSHNGSDYRDVDAQYPGGMLRQQYWQREWYATTGVDKTLGAFELAFSTDVSLQGMNSNQPKDNHVSRQSWLQALSLRYHHGPVTATARLTGYVDWNDNAGSASARNARRCSPSLSLGCRLWQRQTGNGKTGQAELRARAYYKESYRVPTFTECYYYHLGAQDLRPELARQLGAGLVFSASPSAHWTGLSLTVDGYFNRIRDRICAIPYNLYIWRTENIGITRIGGMDVVAAATFEAHPGHSFHLSANYTWQKGSDRTDKGTQSYGKQPAYMPAHSLTAALAYENPWVNMSASLTTVSERWSTNAHTPATRLPAYTECSLGLYRAFRLGERNLLTLRADLLNALNAQYEVIRRYPMPGRNYRLTATVDF